MKFLKKLRQQIPEHKDEKNMRQRVVLKVLAGFMIIMMALTILSRIADSVTIPNIEVTSPKGGRLEHKVEVSGTIKPKDEEDISASAGFNIKDVHVEQGDKVKKGDLLIELDGTDIEEQLSKMEVDLKKINLQIQQLIVDMSETDGGSKQDSDQFAIERLEEDKINAEKAEALKVKRSEENLEIAKQDLETAKNKLEEVKNSSQEEELKKAQKAVEDIKAEIEDKKYEKDKALKKAQMTIDDAEAQYRTVANQGVDITAALQVVERAKGEYNITKKDWERVLEKLEENLKKEEENLANVQSGKTNQEAIKLEEEKVKVAERDVESKKRALTDAIQAQENELNRIKRALEDAKLKLVETKEQEQKSQVEQDKDKQRKNIQKTSLELDKELKIKEINNLSELKESGGQIKAPADGVVTEVKAEKGAKTTGNHLVSLVLEESNYQLEAEVNSEQAEYVVVGDPVIVTLQGEKRPIEGVVINNIVNIPSKDGEESTKKITVILPKGEPGMQATIKIVKETDKYPYIFPAEALREDAKGKYVLVAKESTTTLGKQLVVERIDVVEIDRNSDKVAVQGAIDSKQKIILKSNKPIMAGDRVRLKE